MNRAAPASRNGSILAIAMLLGAFSAASARAADVDRYRLTLATAYQLDSFQSGAADSVRRLQTQGPRAELGFDFRALEVPVGQGPRPALHVTGEIAASRRAFAAAWASPPGSTSPEIDQAWLVELETGVGLEIPLEMVDPRAGASLIVTYEGRLTAATGTAAGWMKGKRFAMGVERTAGFFRGSLAELGYGHDDAFGPQYAARRWSPRLRIQAVLIGPVGGDPAAPAPPAKTAARPASGRPAAAAPPKVAAPEPAPLTLFFDLTAQASGGQGPSALRAQIGVLLDFGAAGSGLARLARWRPRPTTLAGS